jgi:hypothetical protein
VDTILDKHEFTEQQRDTSEEQKTSSLRESKSHDASEFITESVEERFRIALWAPVTAARGRKSERWRFETR